MKNPIVTMDVEGFGVMRFELNPAVAPNTVNNFISLINRGFYNGLTFHRIIGGFVLQGGDPVGNGTGGPGYSIKGEFKSNGVNNCLKHTFGVLSMARSMMPNSAGSQFFVMLGSHQHLDGDYAAFGTLIEGEDVCKNIGAVKTNFNDMPLTPVVIKSATVDTFGESYPEPKKC